MTQQVELVTHDGLTGTKGYADGAQYKAIAAGQTDAVLGATGAQGDLLKSLVCVVTTAATAAVSIKDGAGGSSIAVFPNSPGGGVGTYALNLGLLATTAASGGWRVTTGAGVAVIAVGRFT